MQLLDTNGSEDLLVSLTQFQEDRHFPKIIYLIIDFFALQLRKQTMITIRNLIKVFSLSLDHKQEKFSVLSSNKKI